MTTETSLADAQKAGFAHPTDEPSIVDELLDLDAFLSGDVRRAERSHRFATRPDLEAQIDDLEAELDTLTDDRGRPLDTESTLAGGRTARVVAQEIADLRAQIAASFRTIRLRQLEDADYREWRERWHGDLEKALDQQDPKMWDELVAKSAVAPAMTVDQAAQLRTRMGTAPFEALSVTAWQVNRSQGVSVPKSPLSSAVLNFLQQGLS